MANGATERHGEASSEPTVLDELLSSVLISMTPGIGPRISSRLYDRFGTLHHALAHHWQTLLEVPGIGQTLAQRLTDPEASRLARDEIEACRVAGVTLRYRGGPEYPAMLEPIHDPPVLLYVRGTLVPSDTLSLGVVGSRRATAYGRRQTERLVTSLARVGITIVSGLARGIDGVAHRAALKAGGRTLAVLAGGLAEIYPPEHRGLADQIAGCGALITESCLEARPRRDTFPRRNRIISGLSAGVLVVEATERSGALITARHALEQGRDVFAVPGPVDSPVSRGCHRLIRDGAKLVESVDDILEELGPLQLPSKRDDGVEIRSGYELQLNDLERRVLQVIDDPSTNIDLVVARTGLPVHRVLSTLSVLETRHVIRRLEGNRVARRFQ